MQKADVKQYVYAIIGIVLMFCGWFIPAREPITEVGMQIIGIFIGLVWLWSTSGMLWPSFFGNCGVDRQRLWHDEFCVSCVNR